jgi:hypothetical protein
MGTHERMCSHVPVCRGLFDFRSRRRYGKCPLECFDVPAGQIRYRDECEIRVAPASNIIPGDRLLGHVLASPQRRELTVCGACL